MAGKIFGFISIKGGVGKTTSVINLAHTLVNDFGKTVLVVDCNFSSPNIALQMGVSSYSRTIHHVLSNKTNINNAVYGSQSGFHFIPGSLDYEKINPMNLKKHLDSLKKHYDVILLDSSPTLNEEMLATIVSADELFVITTPDIMTLSTTIKAINSAKQKNMNISGIIINKFKNKRYELSEKDIETLTKVPVISKIPNNIRVHESIAKLKPMVSLNKDSNASISFKKLASYLINANYREPSGLIKMKGYLKDDYNNFMHHNFKSRLKYHH